MKIEWPIFIGTLPFCFAVPILVHHFNDGNAWGQTSGWIAMAIIFAYKQSEGD